MMPARYKAVTLLVLVSFLYGDVLWAVDLQQAYKLASRSGVPQVVKLLERSADVPPDGALIGKIVDESGQIITEYITGEIQGDYLFLWDTRTHDKKLIARIRCKREFVKEDMISELTRLLSESKLPIDSIERRYIEAIIDFSAGSKVRFYVLQEDVRNIYGFANGELFCLYEPFLIIPAGFFHEAGESFFRSDAYRRFLQKETGQKIDWQRYSGKARVVVDGSERLIPAHTYLRGLGKKAREKERKLTDAERLLPKRKGLEDLLFGKENLAVSQMIREQKRITQALREFGEEKWVKKLVKELKGHPGFFPGKDDKEIILFLEDVIKVESVSKLLDLCLNQLLRPNTERPNVDITVYEWFTEIEGLLAVLSRHTPFRRVKRILIPALRLVRKVVRSSDKEGNLERFRRDPFIMKALVRFFNRIEKAELHHHLDGAISPQLILKILCIFPEAREKFVREILKENEGSVNEVFSRLVGGPETEEGWERLRETGESDFIEAFGGIAEYNKALKAIKRYLEYRPIEKGTVNIIEFLEKFMLTGIVLYCNPEALHIIAREATLETYRRDNTTLIEQKMHNLTFGHPLITVVHKVLMGFREAETAANGKLKTSLIMCVFKNPELVLGDKRYKEVAAASQRDNRSIEEIRFSIWEEVALMLQNDYSDDMALLRRYLEQEKEELDSAITELRRMVNRKMPGADSETREKEVRKRLLIFWEERKEGIRQVREIIRVKKQLALNYPDLARRLVGIDTVGSEVDYVTWVHSYSLRLAKRYGFRITDHAGESWPEEDIWQALNRVKGAVETGVVERIGHATALGIHPEMLRETKKGKRFIYTLEELRDIDRLQKEILRTIVEKGIVIETNPSSNLLLLPKYIISYAKHPVHYFWKRLRKRLIVSSDDPHILHTIGLNGEYAKISLAHPNFNFGELLQIIRNSFSNASKPVTEAISRPLWDGVLPEGGDEDLSRFHPLSIINRVRDWDKRLPVLDYQKVGEYPKRLIELEQALTLCAAGWEKARDGSYGTLVTPAGMPAINLMVDSAIERKGLGSKSEIIVIEPPYGCTKNLFERWQRMGFLVHSISVDEIKKKLPGLINKRTAVIYLESVTNPNLMMPDIEYVVKTNRGRAAVLVDDTFATTEMAKSLELGVDMVMLGLTKGMTGTGNIISGAVTAKKEWLDLLARNRNGIPEDKEISRALRGLRHLEVRFAAQSRNAKRVVGRIRRGRHVTSAVYPGNGHMIYHVFKGLRNAQDFIDLLAKFRTVINAVSLGQVRNLFERASGGTHVTVSNIDQMRGRISPSGIRGSVGIEDIHDVLREIDAMLRIISVYGGYTMPREDLDDFQKIFMSEYLTVEEDKKKTRYLLPKWPVVGVDFEKLISDLPDSEKERLIGKYKKDKRFRKAVDIIIKATEITQYDPVTIAIHHRLLWCLLSGNHNAVIGSPDESTTTHKETDQHMQDTFFSILMGVKKGLPPIGNYTLYSRLGKPGICTFELLMTLLEVGIQKALDYEYIGTSFYTERMAYSAFLGQQAEIIMINEMMNVIQRKENVELRNTLLDIARRETGDYEVDSYIDAEYGNLTEAHLRGVGSREILPRLLEDVRLRDPVAYNRFQLEVRARIQKRGLEILIITPRDSVLYKEAKRIEQTDILKFRYIHPEDIDNLEEGISRKTLLVYFDNLRMRDHDPVKIRDIVKGKNPRCMFGITDSFNLGYINPRPERDFDFITHVVYYEKSDKGAVVIARNDKPLLHVWNNPFWSRKNRGTATSEDNAFDMIWYILPYLRVFDERYDENIEAVIKLLSDLVIVKRIDKRHLEIKFKDTDSMERFLSNAMKSNLIDVSIASQDEYFCINEWTSLWLKDPRSLILRIGVEETEDLVKEFKSIVSKFKKKDTGAIGKGTCLEEKEVVVVENMNDRENAVIREAIDRIRESITKAGLKDAELYQAGEVLVLLEEYLTAGNIKVFDARVKNSEDYLLAFPRERDHIIALAKDFLDPDYIIQFYHVLPEILFHEGFAARFGERDYEEHRRIYMGIQRKIFGEYNEVATTLRFYITLKLQGDYEIEFNQRTTKDRDINLDKIASLLRNREFIYRTLKRLYGDYEFMLPHIRIDKIRVEHGGTGSQKQTLHISFIDENTGFKLEFALKVAIHRAAREGFAKGVKDEITALWELSGKCEIPKFGIYVEEPADNFYAYTERWIRGPTGARLIARKRLTKEKLTNIVNAYLSIMKALDSRSKTGGYLGIYDVQTENVMFESWDDDNAITVDIGKIDYVKPLFILQEFDRHYSKGDSGLHEAIFDGVMEIFGIEKGLKFLEEALDDSVADRREEKGFSREMAKGLVDSLKGYVKAVYTKTMTIELSDKLEKMAFAVLDRLANKEDATPLLAEFSQWLEGLHKDAEEAYVNDVSLSNETRLEIIKEILEGVSTLRDLLKISPNLELVEKLLDISFNLETNIPEDTQMRLNVVYPPRDTLDSLNLNSEDVFLSVGAGTGIYNIAACLRGVKKSIYVDVSERNLPFVVRLKKYYEDIKNNPELRGELENEAINDVVKYILWIMLLRKETINLPGHLTMAEIAENPNLWFGETDLPEGVINSPNPPLDIHTADAASMPLPDDSVTKVSAVGLFRWVYEQGGKGKVIRAIKEIFRVTSPGGLILYRVHNPIEKEFIDLFPKVASAMGITVRLKEVTKLGEQVFEVVSKNGDLKERIEQQIAHYGTLKERIEYGSKYVFIDKECLPENQRYILEDVEWEKRKGLLEKMFPGYRFGVFSGSIESGMNRDNTIVLTNKKMEIDARLISITNAGEEEYFPIDALMLLGVGLLNLSHEDRDGSPLVSTITRLYKDITGQDIDIQEFLKNYKLDIILPPIGRFNTELQSYAISLLEQAA